MTTQRSRRETKKYHKHLKTITAVRTDVCEFCEMQPGHPQFVVQTKHFKVVRNLYPYSLWDDHKVADHLMILPKLHIGSLSELDAAANQEFFNLVAVYEKEGYDIFARAPQSTGRTIMHQHTHLIKITNQRRRFVFYMKRPLIRLVR